MEIADTKMFSPCRNSNEPNWREAGTHFLVFFFLNKMKDANLGEHREKNRILENLNCDIIRISWGRVEKKIFIQLGG